jgi:hypothetical protein
MAGGRREDLGRDVKIPKWQAVIRPKDITGLNRPLD